MNIVAIDPGTTQSAFVYLADDGTFRTNKVNNYELLTLLRNRRSEGKLEGVVIEMIASYGMAVGQTVFETCVWIGRFIECIDVPYMLVFRKDVKVHFCGSNKAKDSNVMHAVADKFGGLKAAKGTKKNPGPLYGFSADMWAALAIFLYHKEMAGQRGDSWLAEFNR
jgi:hypothetical protein